ncbi:hypothetical protein [Winogradskyella aurantia]|uniref:Riboflavin synthase subunit beta n=1 Tax=Winogradskyella aurantia TaxID=1915063 RepID=A0A265UQN0_9FLAO|nr:hypothetical protein [Winogradskyella aurantia]OZV67613.1 hypothetical protein CA834_11730 [Winogradskyella aurantia]
MFKQRKHKRFNYKPRFQDSEDYKSNTDFEARWNEAKGSVKRRGSIFTSLPALIVILLALFILMYILDGYIK